MFFSSARFPQALSSTRRLHVVLWSFLGVVVLLCGTLLVSSRARVTTIRMGLQIAGADMAHDEAGFTNLLLLGTGDEGHDGADLTDTMILTSLDPSRTQSAVLLSLPRDLYVQTASGTAVYGRINTMYFLEKSRLEREGWSEEEASVRALASVGQSIGGKLGLEIHGVLKADFTAFTETVDALGGITLTVPEAIVDYQYPLTETRMGTFRIGSGTQLLDGETALKYARSRHSTSDFSRSARQQQLIQAAGSEIRSLGRIGQILFILRLSQRLQGHTETTLSLQEIMGLAQIATEIASDSILTMQLHTDSGGDGWEAAPGGLLTVGDPEQFAGASVLLPLSASGRIDDWSRIRSFAALVMGRRSLFLDPSIVQIRSVPASRVAAWRLRNELLRHGFTVLPNETLVAEEAAAQNGSSLFFTNGRRSQAADVLGALVGLPVERSSQADTGSGDLLMVLDSDYQFVPFGTPEQMM